MCYWIFGAALLNFYFNLHYHLFFRKKSYFIQYSDFSEYDIRMPCMFVGWKRSHQLSTYATSKGMEGVIRTAPYRWRRPHASHARLVVSCFIWKNATSRNNYFCPTRSFSVVIIIYLKLFLQNKVSQNAFNFNQIESYVYSIF